MKGYGTLDIGNVFGLSFGFKKSQKKKFME